jgi:acyl carrier protein
MPEPDPLRRERSAEQTEAEVRRLLAEHGRLRADATRLAADADLYRAGLSSLATVNLMLAIEDAFGFAFADEQLTEATFASIAAIVNAVSADGRG